MIIYNFHPETKEFLGSSQARENPMAAGTYLLPANATFVDTAEPDEGYARVFDTEEETWSTVEDHRGDVVYRKSDASRVVVDWIGEVGSDYTFNVPEPSQEWGGSDWVNPTPTKRQIKEEAQRRILEFCPDWKQRNCMMRMTELVEKKAEGETLTRDELDECDELKAVAAHIKALREDADALELTLPDDYKDDSHWTTTPTIDLEDKFT